MRLISVKSDEETRTSGKKFVPCLLSSSIKLLQLESASNSISADEIKEIKGKIESYKNLVGVMRKRLDAVLKKLNEIK